MTNEALPEPVDTPEAAAVPVDAAAEAAECCDHACESGARDSETPPAETETPSA